MRNRLKADMSKPHRCPDCWTIYDEYRTYDAPMSLHLRNLICPKCGVQREKAVHFYLKRFFWSRPKGAVKSKVWKYDMKLFRRVLPKVGYYSKRHFIKEAKP